MMREPNQTESPIQEDPRIQEEATTQADAPIQESTDHPATRSSLIQGIEADRFNQLTKRNQQFMVD